MHLRKIVLNNIRSYGKDTTIQIPGGTILFQGDIGCGKSTILSAIEFALFGLGDVDGNNLLRYGEKKGSVLLEFLINNKNYQIFRSITRYNKKVVQDEGYIVEKNVITNYSVSEMKSKILKIIKINEKVQTRATSVIYRFAIFTPQEMMKQILSEAPEKRVEILRKAFNIEEYSTIRKNAEIFLSWANGEIRISSEITKDLHEKGTLLHELEQRVCDLTVELGKKEYNISEINKQADKLEIKIGNLKPIETQVLELRISVPHLKETIKRNYNSLSREQQRLEILEEDLNSIAISEARIKQLKPAYEDYLSKKIKLKQLESSLKQYDGLDKERLKFEQNIDNKTRNLESEITRLTLEKNTELEKIEQEEKSMEQLCILEEEESNLKKLISRLPILREESMKILSRIANNKAEKSAIKEQLLKKQKDIRDMVEMGEGATCPTCRQKLDVNHISKVKEEYQTQKQGLEAHLRYLEDAITTCEHEARENNILIHDLEYKDDNLKKLQRQIGKLVEKNDSIQNEKKSLGRKESKIVIIRDILDKESYCIEERNILAQILRDMGTLIKDKEYYAEVEQVISNYGLESIEFKYLENLQETKRMLKVEKEIQVVRKSIDILKTEINSNEQRLQETQCMLDNNSDAIRELGIFENELELLKNKISNLRQEISGIHSELKLLESNSHDIRKEVRDKKDRFSNKLILLQVSNWLLQHFIPSVEDIERHVLQSINEEFVQLFQRWFNILIETGEITVDIDSNFTPIIIQNGYSINVNSLSGGEKTSVALAYRLALNTMLKKVAGMDNTLLILDEPTDGFGKEQLVRLKQVLTELNSAQIIMVSHERELEGFVDRIYRVTKDGNQSRVELATYN